MVVEEEVVALLLVVVGQSGLRVGDKQGTILTQAFWELLAMPAKEVYEIEAVPVHTGGGLDQAEPGTVMGTVVGAHGPSRTLNSLAAGYGGDGEADWEPSPARRSKTGRITLCVATTVLVVVTIVGVVIVATPVEERSPTSASPGVRVYAGGDSEERERPLSPPAPPSPPEPEFAVTLNADIATIPVGSPERQRFEREFAADLAASLGTTADRIRVTRITAGSITVSFQVLDTPAHLDVVGTLIERRPVLAGAEFQTAMAVESSPAPTDGASTDERASCTSRRSCATLAMPDMVAQRANYSWENIEIPANLVRIIDWEHPSNSWPADDGFVTVPLEFDFAFYGLVERHVSIGTNGYLTFGEMAHYPFGNTLIIPTPGGDVGGETVDGLLAVMWTDLDPSAGGAVYYQADPGQLVVTWHTVPYYHSNRTVSSSSTGSTFQAILYNSGVIAMQYKSIDRPDLLTEDGTRHYSIPVSKTTMDRKAFRWPTDGMSFQQMRVHGWSVQAWPNGSQIALSIALIRQTYVANRTWNHICSPIALHPDTTRSMSEGPAMATMIL